MAKKIKEVFNANPTAADNLLKEPHFAIDFGDDTEEAASATQVAVYVDDRLPDSKEVFDSDQAAGGDLTSDYHLTAIRDDGQGGITKVGMDVSNQMANIVALSLNLGSNVADPSSFSMTLDPETLNAVVSPTLTGIPYVKWMIQDVGDAAPLIGDAGWVPGTIHTLYAVDTVWTAATLLARTYSMFVATATTVYEIGPPQTVTPTTTQPVPQTPNDVNFPSFTNVVAGNSITSNTIKILGLLAPTAISVSGGTNAKYSKNGGAFTNVAGVIELNDIIALQQDASGSDSTPTTITVSLGLRDEDWTVTTAATGVAPGVISIVDALYSGAENSTITIDLAVTGKAGDVDIGCRVSTLFVQDYHTAKDGLNYVKIEDQAVEWLGTDTAVKSVTVTNLAAGITLDVVGELVINNGSEFGGATVNPALNAILFTVASLAAGSAYVPDLVGGKYLTKVNFRAAVTAGEATNTPGGGLTWTPIDSPTTAFQSTPLDHVTTEAEDDTAVISFDVDLPVAGAYYFHMKSAGPHWTQNECRISVDDGLPLTYSCDDNDGIFAWGSNNTFARHFVMDAGVHTITFHNNENTYAIEEVIFINSDSYDWLNNAEGEADSGYSGSSGGVDPSNPVIPLGPPLIVDDKTPDPFPFGELTDQLLNPSETTSPVTSQSIVIIGINVPTEIAITSDPSGTAEYQIDSDGWVNAAAAAGFITQGQSIQVRLTMADASSVTRTMDLTIGTVTHTFSAATKASGFIVLTPRTTTYIITSDNEDIQDWDVQVENGDGIVVNAGLNNIKVRGNRISTPNGHAITNNGRGPIIDLLAHNNDIMNCWGSGIYIYGCVSLDIYDNNMENIHTGVDVWLASSGNVNISNNWIKNSFHRAHSVASPNGTGIALDFCSGPNIVVASNIIINEPGKSDVEDKLSMYKTSGTAASPLWAHHNKIYGKSESLSDSTINVGDKGGRYTRVEDNIMVNAGQSGAGVSGGDFHTWRRNKIFCAPLYAFSDPSLGVSNVGIAPFYTWYINGEDAPTSFTFEENEITFWRAANALGKGGVEMLQPYWFVDTSFVGPSSIAGWSTNKFDWQDSQPAGLTEANTWDPAWFTKPVRLT